jgi:hypothetical protein
MAPINKRRERNRVPYDIFNYLSSVDMFDDRKARKKASKKI